MSLLCNRDKDTTNTMDNPYHPIYQCSLNKCVEYFKRRTTKQSNISNTNITIKKLVTCMHCGNSWVVCTACVKAFQGKQNSSKRHFSTIHKEMNNTISTHMLTNNKLSQYKVNDNNMITTFDNDDDQ